MSRHNNRPTAALVVIMTIATSLGLMASLTPNLANATASQILAEQAQAQAELGSQAGTPITLGRPGHQID